MLRIIPIRTHVGDLAAIVFAGAFLAAWIAAGDKHISYAGFQLAFAYFLCVLQGPSPSFDMVVARDRVIGILLANVVSYFAATRVWPVSVGPRIDGALQKAKNKLESVFEAADGWSRRRLVAEAQSMVEGITSDIRLAAYEPVWIQPMPFGLPLSSMRRKQSKNYKRRYRALPELAPEQARNSIQDFLVVGPTAPPAFLYRPRQSKSLAALDTILRVRIAALQQAMSESETGGSRWIKLPSL